MNIGKTEININEVVTTLTNEPIIILATCANDRVTIRPMSHVNDHLTLFFQTGCDSLKMKQITQNPKVALCIGTFEIEGTATAHGFPLAEENAFFADLYLKKHPSSFYKYSSLDDEVVIKVEPHCIRQWQYINGKPFLAEWRKDMEN